MKSCYLSAGWRIQVKLGVFSALEEDVNDASAVSVHQAQGEQK